MASDRPLIGCTTYRKTVQQAPPIDVYGLMPSYAEAIVAAGAIPILIPLNLSEEALADLFERVDGVLLPGGGDIAPHYYHGESHPTVASVDEERDRVELFLARLAYERRKPLLAICRGHQVLNVALGGTLWEDIYSQMPGAMVHNSPLEQRSDRPHEVCLEPGSRLAQIAGAELLPVNSLHHQGVRYLAPSLTATATSPDGLIEGVEGVDHPFAVGVQWHPENLIWLDERMLALFRAFVAAASRA